MWAIYHCTKCPSSTGGLGSAESNLWTSLAKSDGVRGRRENHSFSCTGMDVTQLWSPQTSQQTHQLPAEHFQGQSQQTHKREILVNHPVLQDQFHIYIHSNCKQSYCFDSFWGTFKTLFRGPESLFKYLQIFQSHLPLWFFRICFQLAWGVKICFWIYAILKRLLSCSLPMYIFFKTTKQKGLLEEAPLNKQIIFNV